MAEKKRTWPPVTPLRLVSDGGERMRVPPDNTAAEQALLGALFIDNGAYRRIAGHLRPEHFSFAVHARIYGAVERLIGAGTKANPATLKHLFDQDGALKDIGGARYLARLAKAAVTVSNTEDYAGIIVDLANRRDLIAAIEETLNAAYVLELDHGTAAIIARHQERLDEIRGAAGVRPRLQPLDLADFLALDIPPIEMVMTPWLPDMGLAMIYAERGVGKTLLGVSCAYAISTGTALLEEWAAPRPRRTLYVDSEMAPRLMQERLRAIVAGCTARPRPGYFRFLSGQITPRGLPDLSTREGRAELDAVIGDAEVVFLDNLSTLLRAARENEGDDWVEFQEWLLEHRRNGRAIVMVHHAGKGGMQRGTSRREDVLDTVIRLSHPDDYTIDQAARFIVELDKARAVWGPNAQTFLAQYVEEAGAALWTRTALGTILQQDPADTADELERVTALMRLGKGRRKIVEELGLSDRKVRRLQQQAEKMLKLENVST